MKNLRHPALATLLEEGTIIIHGKRTRYIAWGLIEGEALDAKLRKGALDEQEALWIGRDVVSAITALWSKHIVHRDIVPRICNQSCRECNHGSFRLQIRLMM
jgi:serine/threonine protein kinase